MEGMKAHHRPDRNVFVTGATRGGKTVLANEMHARHGGTAIFWNSEEEENIVGHTCRSIKEMIAACKRYGRTVTIDYRPTTVKPKERQAEFDMFQAFVFDLAETYDRNHNIQVVVDECQDIANQGGSEGGLYVMTKKGLKRGVKVVPASQDPATVSKTIIRQCDFTIWCGGFNQFYEPYFKTYRLPMDAAKGNKQGVALVFSGSDLLYKYRAAAKYA